MILFDTDPKRIQVIKRAIKDAGHNVLWASYTDENECIKALRDNDTTTLWIGTYAEYLIDWIISMQPSIRNIVLYAEHEHDMVCKRLHIAKYKANYVPFELLLERLT